MPEFDFEAAWHGIAGPYFEKLRPEFKAFYKRVAREGKGWSQDKTDLDLIRGAPTDVTDFLADIPSREIAIASHTIYYWGHWAHSGDATLYYPGLPPRVFKDGEDKYCLESARRKAEEYAKQLDQYPSFVNETWRIEVEKHGPRNDADGGASWKCTKLLDKYLQARLRTSHDVSEGLLFSHANVQNQQCWATEEYLDAYNNSLTRFLELRIADPDKAWFTVVEDYQKCKRPYSSSDLVVLAKPLVKDVFEIVDVRSVNHKVNGLPDREAHLFCIGTKHMEAAQKYGGSLGKEAMMAAPCAMKGCGQPYIAHTCEMALFLKCLKDVPNKEAAAVLSAIKDKNESDWKVQLDGFAFMDNQGFKILPPEEPDGPPAPG